MLKWTVVNKRETTTSDPSTQPTASAPRRSAANSCTNQRRSIDALRERKQRRQSARRASLCVRSDKENCCSNTPGNKIESGPGIDNKALRDVSNITPKTNNSRSSTSRQRKSEDFDSPKITRPRKKQCLNPRHIKNHFIAQSNCDKNEARKIILNDRKCGHSCTCCKPLPVSTDSQKTLPSLPMYASTLPSFQMEYSPCLRTTTVSCHNTNSCTNLPYNLKSLTNLNTANCSSKAKIDHVNDFLHQISFITSPEDFRTRNLNANDVNVSPLLRKFVDLRFSRISYKENDDKIKETELDDSSAFNDMSLDKIVDAILDTTVASERLEVRNSRRYSESTLVDKEEKLDLRNSSRRCSESDVVIKENTTVALEQLVRNSRRYAKSTLVDKERRLELRNSSRRYSESDVAIDETSLINTEVNKTEENRLNKMEDVSKRKRSSTSFSEENEENKKQNLQNSSVELNRSFSLKRQKCIRRRKPTLINNNNTEEPTYEIITNTPISANQHSQSQLESLNDNSFSSSVISVKESVTKSSSILSQQLDCLGYSPWRKEICCGLSTPSLERFGKDMAFKRRRSLKRSASSGGGRRKSIVSSTPTKSANGYIDLNISCSKRVLHVNVFQCRDLQRSNSGLINAYVKVALIPNITGSANKTRSAPQRTAVQAESANPQFDHKFTFKLSKFDINNKVQLEVWHRDRSQRRSEFLGCMSFPVKHAVKKDINGSYKLQSTVRCQYQQNQTIQSLVPPELPGESEPPHTNTTTTTITMCETSQSSVEEILSLDEPADTEIVKKASSKTSLNQQQKDADENLFLRYLELDPTEGPEAIPAALQRKAIGNKFGKTPFTTTKRLVRQARSGFGFSVVWTHPPRIERVEKGLPADKAGILPGDYIIFVDKNNVVMMAEIDILNLIRSYGSQLTLEIFRRNSSKNGGIATARPGMQAMNGSDATIPSVTFQTQHRPSTGCSTNTVSVDLSRRRLHLPQVTFTSEKPASTEDEARRRSMYQLINKEQQYATALQFAVTRFVSALAERRDLITPQEHHVLFQNSEEILRITEDIIDNLVHDDGDPQIQLLIKTYELKLGELLSAYKRYFAGLKRADYLLATKTKNSNSEFVRFLQTPAIPRRRPDITSFIHKPLEHYRDILKLLSTILSHTKSNQEDYQSISRVVHEMQAVYREITAEAGLMEPVGEGRPLLSVQDLENRLVFTKCKPFVLSKPGRQWIFGGDLSRVEGRTIRTYWALLFSDLILFAKVSRDRVLFITEEPLPLSHITEIYFNVRKKATEFRITVDPGGRNAQSPTAHCGPDLTRTPRKSAGKRCVVLRAPTMELKAVWQNLLQRQLYHVNSGMDGSSLSSPLDSPDVPITSSVATLQSADNTSHSQLSMRRQGQRRINSSMSSEMQKQIDELIEHKCKQLGKTSSNKGGAIHLEQWMKGQLGNNRSDTPDYEPEPELWTEEELMQRTKELKLIDLSTDSDNLHGVLTRQHEFNRDDSRCEELVLSDHEQSPSRSTTTESQVTVRSSPVVPEQVSVCKQCHETCLSNTNSPNLNIHHTNNNVIHNKCPNNTNNNKITNNNSGITEEEENEWGSLMLMGLAAINPTTSFVKLDPFAPKLVPKIAVMPPTPDQTTVNHTFSGKFSCSNDVTNSPLKRKIVTNLDLVKDYEDSPDDSPQNEHPYIALENCNQALRRYGTLSSLEKLTSDDFSETLKNTSSESEEEEEEEEEEDTSTKTDPGQQIAFTTSLRSWTAKAGSYVSEKISFFERFTDDSREGFFGILKQGEALKNSEDDGKDEECETSGATSGEEIWGTPTSGGEMEDPHSFPNSDGGNLSPQSINSTNEDDTELMMDELLMAPPMTAAAVRGLLPRRRLEPLMEEDDSDTYTSSSTSSTASSSDKATPSPEEGNGTGAVADDCSSAAAHVNHSLENLNNRAVVSNPNTSRAVCTNPILGRSPSYRHIVDQAEDETLYNLPTTLSPLHHHLHHHQILTSVPIFAKFKNIEPTRIPVRTKSIKLFDFFNARRNERRVHESNGSGRQLLRVFNKEASIPETVPNEITQKPLSPMLNKDKQLDRRFWKQLSKRRRTNRVPQIPA